MKQETNTTHFAKIPGGIQAFVLMVASGLTVLVTAILGPSLPAMQAHFADVPGADYLVPLTMSAPMLTMAIVSVFAGALTDRFGRKRILVLATALYAFVGTAPLYLDSLYAIIASRIALGVVEAFVMTVSTTMIGDYFHGAKREKYMSLQTTVSSASAFLLNTLGGIVAEHGWRAPYYVFTISLVLLPLMVIFLWEPKHHSENPEMSTIHDEVPFRPGMLVFVSVLAVLLGVMFLTVPVHFGYLFGAVGVQSPSMIGAGYGLNSLGVIAGTLLFGWIFAPRLPVNLQLAVGCLVAGLGFVLMQSATDFDSLTIAGVVNGVGAGVLLPAMVTWNMRLLPFSRRGLGTGAFQSSLFFGMFINPLLIVAMEKANGGLRAVAVGQLGYLFLGLAVLAFSVLFFQNKKIDLDPHTNQC